MIEFVISNNVLLSAHIRQLAINTNWSALTVTISNNTGKAVFTQKLYAYNGTVDVSDLRSLIEDDMAQSGTPFARFNIRAAVDRDEANKPDDDGEWPADAWLEGPECINETDIFVLFCDQEPPQGFDTDKLRNSFLTTATARRIAPSDSFSLAFFAKVGDTTVCKAIAVYSDSNNNIASAQFVVDAPDSVNASADSVCLFSSSAPRIAQLLAQAVNDNNVSLRSFSISCDNRAAAFFIDPSLISARRFFFKNCFNAQDAIRIPGVFKEKSTADRSTATVNGLAQFYDQSSLTEFSIDSAPLTYDECKLFQQLCISRSASDELNRQILITDFSCEISDTDEKPNSVKITWRLQLSSPCLTAEDSTGIFTSQYNFIFA